MDERWKEIQCEKDLDVLGFTILGYVEKVYPTLPNAIKESCTNIYICLNHEGIKLAVRNEGDTACTVIGKGTQEDIMNMALVDSETESCKYSISLSDRLEQIITARFMRVRKPRIPARYVPLIKHHRQMVADGLPTANFIKLLVICEAQMYSGYLPIDVSEAISLLEKEPDESFYRITEEIYKAALLGDYKVI